MDTASTDTVTLGRDRPDGIGKRPATATVAVVFQLALGSFTSIAGTVFSIVAGGAWGVASACLFVVALFLWWTAGLGQIRGTRRGHALGIAMLSALMVFNGFKIILVHEQAAYLFTALTVIGFALALARPTRKWAAHATR